MSSPFALAARRRILNSLIISGGVHVAAIGAVLLDVAVRPQPHALQANMSSVAIVSSMISVDAADASISPPVAITPATESNNFEEVPTRHESLLPTVAAQVGTQKVASDGERLLGKRHEPVSTPSARIAAQSVSRRKADPEIRRVKVPPAAHALARIDVPPELNVSTAAPQLESLDARESQGAKFDQLPIIVDNPAPIYPAEALAQRREGRVILRAFVDKTGLVSEVSVLRSCGNAQLDRAALVAVKKWKFTPGQRLGVNVAGEVAVPVVFQIAK